MITKNELDDLRIYVDSANYDTRVFLTELIDTYERWREVDIDPEQYKAVFEENEGLREQVEDLDWQAEELRGVCDELRLEVKLLQDELRAK